MICEKGPECEKGLEEQEQEEEEEEEEEEEHRRRLMLAAVEWSRAVATTPPVHPPAMQVEWS